MRYHYEKPRIYQSKYGKTHICDHPVYDRCTLFEIGDKKLAVIQQRYNPETKETRWTEIDPWLTDAIYLNPGFKNLFDKRSKTTTESSSDNENFSNPLYPTMTVRQVMWALKMKPLKRERWETVFDRKLI